MERAFTERAYAGSKNLSASRILSRPFRCWMPLLDVVAAGCLEADGPDRVLAARVRFFDSSRDLSDRFPLWLTAAAS
jgi:hypothetical protein